MMYFLEIQTCEDCQEMSTVWVTVETEPLDLSNLSKLTLMVHSPLVILGLGMGE